MIRVRSEHIVRGCLLSAAALTCGCHSSSSLPKTYAVKGQVVDVEGRPVARGRVELSNTGESPTWRARGVIRADGTFSISTYSTTDDGSAAGAPEGPYTVVVVPRGDDGDQTHQTTPRRITLAGTYTVAPNDGNDFTLTLPAEDRP